MRLWMKTNAGELEITHERRQPMEPERFRAVCLLIGFTLYVGMVSVVAWLCGFWALLWLWGITAILVIVALLRGIDF